MARLVRLLESRFPKAVWLPWLVSLSGGLLFFYEFIQLNIINSISTELMADFHINAAVLGSLSSTYFYANVICLFLAGNLLDRFSTRILILLAMLFCTLGTFGFGVSSSVLFAGICRALVGVGGSFCLLSAIRLASRWFPPRRLALLTGLIVMMAMLGGWVAQMPATLLVNALGWRGMMLVNTALGVALTVWLWFVIQDHPSHAAESAQETQNKLKQFGLWQSITFVLRNKQNWLAGSYTCLLNLPIFLLGAMWGRMYLMQVDHLTATQASFVCGMLFWGSIIGSPLMGFISDSMGVRRLPMLIFAAASLVVILPTLYLTGLSVSTLAILYFVLGVVTCSQVISYPLVAEHNPAMLIGTAVSIVSITCLLGGALGFPFSGWLLDLGWQHTFANGMPLYSAADFHHMLLIMPAAFVIALFIAWRVKETYCKPQYDLDGNSVHILS